MLWRVAVCVEHFSSVTSDVAYEGSIQQGSSLGFRAWMSQGSSSLPDMNKGMRVEVYLLMLWTHDLCCWRLDHRFPGKAKIRQTPHQNNSYPPEALTEGRTQLMTELDFSRQEIKDREAQRLWIGSSTAQALLNQCKINPSPREPIYTG